MSDLGASTPLTALRVDISTGKSTVSVGNESMSFKSIHETIVKSVAQAVPHAVAQAVPQAVANSI